MAQQNSMKNNNLNSFIKDKKNSSKSLTGLQLQQYIKQILAIFKFVSFHQIYVHANFIMQMQKQRQRLCKLEHFDPLTAFKAIDAFKHNKIVDMELKSFLQHQQKDHYKLNYDQCQQVLQSINKSIIAMQYDDFEQMIMPIMDINLRNKSLSRYESNCSMSVSVGTMAQVYEIKSVSAKQISKYFIKQIQFYRQLLLKKQIFCQKYGGDLYTLIQNLTKGNKNTINFNRLYQFARNYQCYFNQQQFISLFRRTKSQKITNVLFYDSINEKQGNEIVLDYTNLSHVLLADAKKLSVKEKIRIIDGVQISKDDKSKNILPSYSYKNGSIWHRQQATKIQKQKQQKQKFIKQSRQNQTKDKRNIKYQYAYPSLIYSDKGKQRNQLKQLQHKWKEDVNNMRGTQNDIRYGIIDNKYYFI